MVNEMYKYLHEKLLKLQRDVKIETFLNNS